MARGDCAWIVGRSTELQPPLLVKHWGGKWTKPKHWGFLDYYPFTKTKRGNFLSPLSSPFSLLSSLLSPLSSLYAMAKSAEDVREREGENGRSGDAADVHLSSRRNFPPSRERGRRAREGQGVEAKKVGPQKSMEMGGEERREGKREEESGEEDEETRDGNDFRRARKRSGNGENNFSPARERWRDICGGASLFATEIFRHERSKREREAIGIERQRDRRRERSK